LIDRLDSLDAQATLVKAQSGGNGFALSWVAR
jgi:hypothetical protein